jgi:hypothetical protein
MLVMFSYSFGGHFVCILGYFSALGIIWGNLGPKVRKRAEKHSYLIIIRIPFWRPKSTKMKVKMSIDFGIDF